MPLGTIKEIIKTNLTYLQGTIPAQLDTDIDNLIIAQQYNLQPFTELEDSEVEVEASYSNQQKLLLAYLVEYDLLCKKSLESTTTTDGKSGNRDIKRAQADVTEVEFQTADFSKSGFGLNAKELISKTLQKICQQATLLGYELPICRQLDDGDTVLTPFITKIDKTGY